MLSSFLQWRKEWLLIPEVDFIISCMAVMTSSESRAARNSHFRFSRGEGEPFLSGRAMRFKRRVGVWAESPKVPQAE